MIKAVIVDFDDTLCLTEEACYQLENEALRRMGRGLIDRQLYHQTWGQPVFDAIKTRSPGVDVGEYRKIHASAHMEWIDAGKIDVVTPGNLRVLDDILEKGKMVFILTSRSQVELHHILAPDHDLAKRIKAFYYRDIMLFHKPDPRAFDHLLKNHRLIVQECVYVGDTPSDAKAAKGAGLHFVASLEAGIRTRKDFGNEQVDCFIRKFTSLPRALALIERRQR